MKQSKIFARIKGKMPSIKAKFQMGVLEKSFICVTDFRNLSYHVSTVLLFKKPSGV